MGLTSGRTCTPTPSCPEAPPCTPVLLTACRRRSPPWLPPPSRSRSSLPREEVLRLDWRLHPGFPLHLPADVDLKAGVRRVWPLNCAQEVLLRSFSSQAANAPSVCLYPLQTFLHLNPHLMSFLMHLPLFVPRRKGKLNM